MDQVSLSLTVHLLNNVANSAIASHFAIYFGITRAAEAGAESPW